jgi:hypothetical protein
MAKFTIDRSEQQAGAEQYSMPSRLTVERATDAAHGALGAFETAGSWLADTFGPSGNLRGSAIGGVMQGMADPVVGAVQFAANLPGIRSLAGE